LHAIEAHRLYVVEVRHPVEVPGNERSHLQQWLTKRCGWVVRAPELAGAGLKLVGGRLLPGSGGPASFMMYESASGERFTIYTAKSNAEATQMRFAAEGKESTLFWADDGVVYAVVSTGADRGRLSQIAQAVYDQMEKKS
jgi:anti-sigma factor RsiW